MKKIIINYRSAHHAGYSGYDRVLDYLNEPIKIPNDGSESTMSYKLSKFLGSLVDKDKGEYDSNSVIKEVELYRKLKELKDNKKVVHYLNAERDIRFVVNYKRFFKNTSFIGTFHKPNKILKEQIPDIKYLKKLDGAICVGPNQIEFLKNWLDIDNVNFIPHGVDTKFFKPDFTKRKDNSLIFVGQHLRDFEALNYCVPKIAEKIKDLKVNVILHKSYKKHVKSHPCIKVFSGIQDTELKNYYQSATALFLPLLDSTACNSILEAMAVGLPIITTNVGGNYGYLTANNAILTPKKDYDFLIDASIKLLKSEERIMTMSHSSREASKEFDWVKVAKQINEFYNVCAGF